MNTANWMLIIFIAGILFGVFLRSMDDTGGRYKNGYQPKESCNSAPPTGGTSQQDE